jgi:putative transposase
MLKLPQLAKFLRTFLRVLLDVLTVFRTGLRFRGALAAENLFLRKQLALYLERKKRPRWATDAVRFTMALLATFFEWRPALTIVKPDTLIRWHRKGFQLFWKCKSRPGRPRIPQELRQLIANMVRSNPSWGEERIASEHLLKIGIQIFRAQCADTCLISRGESSRPRAG